MAVSRMLRFQLLAHDSVREEIKLFLSDAGVVEVVDSSVEELRSRFDEDDLRELEQVLEKIDSSIGFLSQFMKKPSLMQRLSAVPIRVTESDIDALLDDVDIDGVWKRCESIQQGMRRKSDELAKSKELVRALEPWTSVGVPLEHLSTERYTVSFWVFPEKKFSSVVESFETEYPETAVEEVNRADGRSYAAFIVSKEAEDEIAEKLKLAGGYRNDFKGFEGTPAEVIERERRSWDEIERAMENLRGEAAELSAVRDKLFVLYDHFNEEIALRNVERHLVNTESTFLIEGWVRARDAASLERNLSEKFDETAIFFREPAEDEDPPIYLENKKLFVPFEFVTTLYGRPNYKEIDPTPLLAPFFVLFFAMCLTDAGYGATLAAVSGLAIMKLKPRGGLGKLLKVLFYGGIVTAVVGFVTGGVFGISLESAPDYIKQFIVIDPLKEPMKMLNIAFLIGVVHILFGMGIRMVSNFKSHNLQDALFDDLAWILFIIALAPLGYMGILGGKVPPVIVLQAKRASLVLAGVIFLTGGRKEKNIIKRILKGVIGFYDIVGYFGDVLSYARLLALGLATSAIAIAVNGIAKMVLGLPFYTGYVAAVIVLVMGHLFNMAVNTLGAFVHSGRLQYLEFFSKFFTGGGKGFKPFKSERRYTVLERRKI